LGNLQPGPDIRRELEIQSMRAPMRSIGIASIEITKIGRNRMKAMTARMQIHTIHMK